MLRSELEDVFAIGAEGSHQGVMFVVKVSGGGGVVAAVAQVLGGSFCQSRPDEIGLGVEILELCRLRETGSTTVLQ